MKAFILTTLAQFCLLALAAAQPCDLPTLLKQPGYWEEEQNPARSGIAAADLTRQRTVVSNIVQPPKKKYAPKGVDVYFHSAFFDESRVPLKVNTGNYYTVDFTFAKHDCPYNKAKILEKLSEGRELEVVRIHINDFAFTFSQSFFVPSEPYQENPMTDAFALVDDLAVKEGVAWYWGKGTGGRTGDKEQYWLITLDGKLPFYYVSQKEFAGNLKVYYEKKIKEAETNYANNLKTAEETYKQLKSISATEANKFKEQSAVQYKKQLEIDKGQYTKNLAVVDKILLSDEKTLSEPAIIDRIKGYFDFQGFVAPDHIYSSYVIRPNPAYFNAKLPKSSPQFMSLYFDIPDEPIFKMANEEFLKALDFSALQAMLGK